MECDSFSHCSGHTHTVPSVPFADRDGVVWLTVVMVQCWGVREKVLSKTCERKRKAKKKSKDEKESERWTPGWQITINEKSRKQKRQRLNRVETEMTNRTELAFQRRTWPHRKQKIVRVVIQTTARELLQMPRSLVQLNKSWLDKYTYLKQVWLN